MSNIECTECEAKMVLEAVAWPTGPLTEREKHFVRLLGVMREDRDHWRQQARGGVPADDAAVERMVALLCRYGWTHEVREALVRDLLDAAREGQ